MLLRFPTIELISDNGCLLHGYLTKPARKGFSLPVKEACFNCLGRLQSLQPIMLNLVTEPDQQVTIDVTQTMR